MYYCKRSEKSGFAISSFVPLGVQTVQSMGYLLAILTTCQMKPTPQCRAVVDRCCGKWRVGSRQERSKDPTVEPLKCQDCCLVNGFKLGQTLQLEQENCQNKVNFPHRTISLPRRVTTTLWHYIGLNYVQALNMAVVGFCLSHGGELSTKSLRER